MNRKYGQMRLVEGLDTIEAWSVTATQSERNGLHEMLFAVADSALLRTYPVTDGEVRGMVSVLVKADLVVCLTFPEPGAFGVAAIGHPSEIATETSNNL